MELKEAFSSTLIFFVNGRKITDENVDPSVTLLTYLREKLLLPGTKMGCNEGGCGACTVMVSKIDANTGKIKHYSVNACLAPIGTMHGLSVITVEGIGSTKTRLHPVQERLAKSHGSQCGFCTPGFVMSMYTLLRNNPEPTMKEIEENLAGNLCRCTGYRPILEGFRTFTKESQGCGRTDCCKLKNTNKSEAEIKTKKTEDLKQTTVLFDPKLFKPYDPSQEVIFPPELKMNPHIFSQNVIFRSSQLSFYRIVSIQELIKLKHSHPEAKIVIGNTEVGIEVKFKNQKYPVIINPVNIPELTKIEVQDTYVEIGAGASLSDIDTSLKTIIEKLPKSKTKILASIVEMLQWFAGRQIRNVACLGGNIMTGSPISDLNPILMAAEAKLKFQSLDGEREVLFNHEFYTGYRKNIAKPEEVLVSIKIPFTTEEQFFQSYKQARRREDDISIVNSAMKVSLDLKTLTVKSIYLAFGGMAPTIIMAMKTMKELQGSIWDGKLAEKATSLLMEELQLLPSTPGGMVNYRMTLTGSFFFKFFVSVCEELNSITLNGSSQLKNLNKEIIERRSDMCTKSVQFFEKVPEDQEEIDPIGRPITHVSALKQVTGEATYIDDIPRFENELYASLVVSSRAHAKILSIDATEALKLEGVEGFFGANDLPGERNKTGCIVHDEEVFASEQVYCVGQVIAIVVASSQTLAQKAAKMVKVEYQDLPNPIFTIEAAIEANSVWEPLVIESGNTEEGFKNSKHILEGQVRIGGQEHFYLETNVHIAIPHEEDEIELISSTQNASELQQLTAKALDLKANRVNCKVKRIGGGFGGKQSRSNAIAIPLALAASKIKKPIRMVLDRDEDMLITGGRQPFLAKWKVGFGDDGQLHALNTQFYSNTGWSLDLAEAVMMKALFNANNVYKIENLRVFGQCCKTNLPSNTAFRGFGNPQAIFVMEYIMSNVADHLRLDPLKVREQNMYKKSVNYTTHYGQEISNNTAEDCWNLVLSNSNYQKRKEDVENYNRNNTYRKRGICAMPLKFGVAYEVPFLNQGGALILVYTDGSILLSHGGMEMGQGLHTKMIQVASRELQVPMDIIHISDTSTDKVPNTTATAASISSDLNGMAVLNACKKIVRRLEPYKAKLPEGKWKDWVSAAYFDRVCLSATGFYKTPNIEEFNFKDGKGKPATPFNYFVFGATVSEVEIDTLTGDHTVLRTDIVMDIGKSLNPAIDIGQIEGAFTQGYGLFTLEQLLYSPKGELITKGPGTYKIPGIQDIPREFNVTLLRESSNERAIYSSKAVGEPPLLSGAGVFLAIRHAVQSARSDKSENFQFDAPATAERIRMACNDWITRNIKTTTNGPFTPWSIEV